MRLLGALGEKKLTENSFSSNRWETFNIRPGIAMVEEDIPARRIKGKGKGILP